MMTLLQEDRLNGLLEVAHDLLVVETKLAVQLLQDGDVLMACLAGHQDISVLQELHYQFRACTLTGCIIVSAAVSKASKEKKVTMLRNCQWQPASCCFAKAARLT